MFWSVLLYGDSFASVLGMMNGLLWFSIKRWLMNLQLTEILAGIVYFLFLLEGSSSKQKQKQANNSAAVLAPTAFKIER